jgi:hypothetical protein
MTEKERYLAIAAKYHPEDVEAIPVEKSGPDGHRGKAYLHEEFDEEGNELPRKMEVPVPDTLGRLWVYLHECAHFRLNHGRLMPDSNDYSRGEAEVNLEVMRIFDEEGLTAPLRVLLSEFEAFFPHVRDEDERYRHETVTRAIDEFHRRIKAARNRK